MLLTYFLNDFEMVPVAPVTSVITLGSTFHIRCISVVNYLYFKIFSASFLITFLSPEIAIITIIIIIIFILHKTYRHTHTQTHTHTHRHTHTHTHTHRHTHTDTHTHTQTHTDTHTHTHTHRHTHTHTHTQTHLYLYLCIRSVCWISCCPQAEQNLPNLSKPREGLGLPSSTENSKRNKLNLRTE
jgi:ABC-type nickel/cobalt efflux system permease component RcnA